MARSMPAMPPSTLGYSDKTFQDLEHSGDSDKTIQPSSEQHRGTSRSSKKVFFIWVLFIASRAVHPMLIDLSKGPDGQLPYSKLSPVIVKAFLIVAACHAAALRDKDGWQAGLRNCYNQKSLLILGPLGAIYSVGDCLEMKAMSSMDGAAYQVLSQSKLVVTALLMWAVKGRSGGQSSVQWSVLVTMSLGMSMFMLCRTANEAPGVVTGERSSGGEVISALTVISKVLVSCLAAVTADKLLKKRTKLPLYAQLCHGMLGWGCASLLLALVLEPSLGSLLSGWSSATVLVMLSFSVKMLLTVGVLKILDSLLKNIGEAVAVLVIYFAQVLSPRSEMTFDLSTFLAMLTVVTAVLTYVLLRRDEKKGGPSPE